MLKIGALLIAAALAASASIPLAHPSQPPSPRTAPQSSAIQSPSHGGNADSASHDKGTVKRPLVVEAHTTPESQAEAAHDANYQQQKAAMEDAHEIGAASIVVGALQTIALVITFMVIAFVAVRQLRAYIYPGTTSVKNFALPGPIVIVVQMKNSGQTPAREFECHGNSFVAAVPLLDDTFPEPTEDPSGAHSRGVLFPNDPYTVEFECIDKLDAATVAEMKKSVPKVAIYVAGEVHYRDIFGRKRRSRFCRYIEPEDAAWLIALQDGRVAHDKRIIRFTTAPIANEFR